jgi:hypothetical protein
MLAGHIGVALAAQRVERRLNLGTLIFAALLLDVLLWCLLLAGIESAEIPADFAQRHQLRFDFPYSHGLAGSLVWSALAAAAAYAWGAGGADVRGRAACLVAATVFSHELLDMLVHVPELPLVGSDSAKLGLSLWNHLPIALSVEVALTGAGLWLFLHGSPLARWRRNGVIILTACVAVFTVLGMTLAPVPPSSRAVAWSSLATIVALALIAGVLDRPAVPRPPPKASA